MARRIIEKVNPKTGEVVETFSKLSDVCDLYGWSYPIVSQCVNKGMELGGYIFQWRQGTDRPKEYYDAYTAFSDKSDDKYLAPTTDPKAPHYIVNVSNRILITALDIRIPSVRDALTKYLIALSNFGCRPMHDYNFIAEYPNLKEARQALPSHKKDIVILPQVSGDNMVPIPNKNINPDYKHHCPVCGREGRSGHFLNNHFDNCTMEPVDYLETDAD
jgi:hypothetical protein